MLFKTKVYGLENGNKGKEDKKTQPSVILVLFKQLDKNA